MRQIVDADEPFVREEVARDEGLRIFADQPFKREIIEAVDTSEVGAGTVISVYLDNNTEKAVTVGTGSLTDLAGFDLYQDRLIARSTITSNTLNIAKANGDTDITSIYTMSSDNSSTTEPTAGR